MLVVDLHADTIARLLYEGGNFDHNPYMIDLEKLKKGHYLLQNLALFTYREGLEVPEITTMNLVDKYYEVLEKYPDDVAMVLRFEDIKKNYENHKISLLLTLEDGGVVFNDLSMLRNYYRLGVRMIALTWNFFNGIGYPNVKGDDIYHIEKEKGLTKFGLAYIKEMERLGIIIDVSHLGDKGFWDVYHNTTKPFVASHSNAREICGVARNLDDAMIKALASRGGVIGINYCAAFLKDGAEVSKIEDMIKHIKHLRKVGGIDCIALGSDFDGIHGELELRDASYLPKLEKALYDEGFKKEEVAKIFYQNALRVYEEVLK